MVTRLLQFITLSILIELCTLCAGAAEIVVLYEDSVSDYKVAMQNFVDSLSVANQKKCEYIGYSEIEKSLGKLTESNCKLCVTIGIRPAKVATDNLPDDVAIAYCMVFAPESLKLYDNDKYFGISLRVDPERQLSFIKKVIPDIGNIYTFVRDKDDISSSHELSVFNTSSVYLNTVEMPENVKNSDRPDYVNSLIKKRPDVIWTYPDSHTFNMITIKLTLLGGIKNQVPVFGYSEKVVKAGALFGVAVVPETQGVQLAQMVNAYLDGNEIKKKHRYAEFEPAFNLSVAEKLKIKIPEDMLEKTDYIYGDIDKYRKNLGR